MVGNSVCSRIQSYTACVQVVLVVRSVKEWHGGGTRPTQDEVRGKRERMEVNIKTMMLCYMLIDEGAEGRNRNRAGLRVSSRVRV